MLKTVTQSHTRKQQMPITLSSYSRVICIGQHPHAGAEYAACYDAGHLPIYQNSAFDYLGSMIEGCYEETEDSESRDLFVGTYIEVDEWLDVLCQLAHGIRLADFRSQTKKGSTADFLELLNFGVDPTFWPAGIIGTDIAKRISEQMVALRPKLSKRVAKNKNEELPDKPWLNRYDEWMDALQVAGNGGVLIFD